MLRMASTDDKIRKVVRNPMIVPMIIGPTFIVLLTIMPKKRTIIRESIAAIKPTTINLTHWVSVVGVQKFFVAVNSLYEETIKQKTRINMRNSVMNVSTFLPQIVIKRPQMNRKTPIR